MSSTLWTAWNRTLTQYPQRDALWTDEEKFTYRELQERAEVLAGAVQESGVVAGDWVGLWFSPCADFFASLLALWRLGATAVVFNPKLPEAANQRIAASVKTSLTLCNELPPGSIPGPFLETPGIQGCVSRAVLPAESPASDGDTALIQFTSGSTGTNKPVILSHRALGLNATWTRDALGLTSSDRWFCNMPYCSMSGISHFLTQIVTGSCFYAIDRFAFPEQMVQLLGDFQATGIGGSPIQARWLLEFLTPGDSRLATLRRIMTSGDKLPDFLYGVMEEKVPHCRLVCVYGLTELGGRFCVYQPAAGNKKRGTVGRPIGGMRVEIRNPDTLDLVAPGEVGEVYAVGPMRADGYFGLADATASTFTPCGIRTGDLGCLDAEGDLHLVGRRDDVFKSSGEKVSTVAIEQCVLAMGRFTDVAVVAVPDAYLGKVAVLFYVPRPGHEVEPVDIINHIQAELPPSHLPHEVRCVAGIPRTLTGKVDRTALQKLAQTPVKQAS